MQTIWGYADTKNSSGLSLLTEDGVRVAIERGVGIRVESDGDGELPRIEDGKLVVVEGEVLEREFDDSVAYRQAALERPSRVRAHRIAVGQLAYRRIAESFQMRAIANEEYVDPFEDIDSVAVPLFSEDQNGDPSEAPAGALTATDITPAALRAYPGIFLPVLCLGFFVAMTALTLRIWNPVHLAGTELIQIAAHSFAWLSGFVAMCPQIRPPPLFVHNEPLDRVTTATYLPLVTSLLLPLTPFVIDLAAGLLGTTMVAVFTLLISVMYLRTQRGRRAESIAYAEAFLRDLPARAERSSLSDESLQSAVGVWTGVVVDPTPSLVGEQPVALARTHDTVLKKLDTDASGQSTGDGATSDGATDSSADISPESASDVRHEWSRFQTRDTFLIDTGDGVIEVDPTDLVWTSTYAIRARVLKPEELMRSSEFEPFRHCAIPVGGRVLVAGRVERAPRVAEWQLRRVGDRRPLVIAGGPSSVPEPYIRKALRSRRRTVYGLWIVTVAHGLTMAGLLLRQAVLSF